jgi:hypothetical protein
MLKISWKESPFNYIYQRMLYGETDSAGNVTFAGIPANTFIDKRFVVVPFTYETQPFLLEVDVADTVLNINIQNQTPYLQTNPIKQTSIYMLNTKQTVLLQLAEGYNYVVVTNNKTQETAFIVINCKRYATLLWAFAQEIYNNIQSILVEQQTAIFSKYATRLVEPLMARVYSLLPSVKSLQMLSTRLITKTLVGKSGTDLGVSEMGSAFTLNHPFFSSLDKTTTDLDFSRYPLENYQEYLSGKIAHIWIPSFSLVRWKSFITFMNNLQGMTLNQIDEDEVIVTDQNGAVQRHFFNPDPTDFFQQTQRVTLDIFGTLSSTLPINFIAPGYPFDMVITDDNLLGQDVASWDLGNLWDSGISWDADTLDPQLTFLGMSLIDRNEQAFIYSDTLGYDSTMFPMFGTIVNPLVYTLGYYVKCAELETESASLDEIATMSGTFSDGTMVDEDDGLFVPFPSGTANLDDGIFGGAGVNYDDGTF